jgi:hypothetical protein
MVMSPVLMFCTPVFIFYGTEGVESIFHFLRFQTCFRLYRRRWIQFLMFSSPGPTLVGTEGVESYFLVLRSQTRFGLYRGRRVAFACFALPDSFWAVLGASGLIFMLWAPIFMFCSPGLVFDDTDGVESGIFFAP